VLSYRSNHGSTTTSIHLTGDPRRWASCSGAAGAVPSSARSCTARHSDRPHRRKSARALAHLEQVILLRPVDDLWAGPGAGGREFRADLAALVLLARPGGVHDDLSRPAPLCEGAQATACRRRSPALPARSARASTSGPARPAGRSRPCCRARRLSSVYQGRVGHRDYQHRTANKLLRGVRRSEAPFWLQARCGTGNVKY
jgi:hypothetical protein